MNAQPNYRSMSHNNKDRKRRVRTEHSNPNQTFSSEKPNFQDNYDNSEFQPIPQTIIQRLPPDFGRFNTNSSIQEIFKHIQKPVKYQQMSIGQIADEKSMLQDHVMFLNSELDELLKKRLSRIEEGVSRRLHKGPKNNSRVKYNDWDDAGIQRQVLTNNKLLILLQDQYDSLQLKLGKMQGCDYNVKCDNLIKQSKQELAKMRLFLSQRKRKNVLNGKKITNLDNSDTHKIYFDLQQQYVTFSKKKQQYQKKMDRINQQNAKIVEKNSKIQHQSSQLKKQASQIEKNLPNQLQEQHNKMMYETKCRKMDLCMKKRQRQQQSNKRKYYGLLKDYEKIFQHNKFLDQKIKHIQQKIKKLQNKSRFKQQTIEANQYNQEQGQKQQFRIWRAPNNKQENEQFQKMQQKVQKDQQNDQNVQEQIRSQNNDGFMLTELNNQKYTTKIQKNNREIVENEQNRSKLPEVHNIKNKSHSQYQYRPGNKIMPFKMKIFTRKQVNEYKNQKQENQNKIILRNNNSFLKSQASQKTEKQMDDENVSSRKTEKKQTNIFRRVLNNKKNTLKQFQKQYQDDFQPMT